VLPLGRGGGRLCRFVGVALALLAGALSCASSAVALLRPLEPRQEVAVLGNGIVWVDQERVLFQGFRSGSATLGGVESSSPTLASSGKAVALLGRGSRGGFAAAIPPGRFAPIEQISEGVHGGGCTSWVPLFGGESLLGDFAVAGDELIDAGECQGENGGISEQEGATSQPLFVRNVRGGEWRVLRWLKGHYPPILATEGSLLAIGAQVSLTNMRVTILDLATGRLLAQFDTPDGYLSFASPRRLVLSVPIPLHAEQADLPSAVKLAQPPRRARLRAYRSELYSLGGRRLVDLGQAPEPPLVSHMHLLSDESVTGGRVLAVRSVLGGASRRLIGFNDPARSLVGLAFRWPVVAVVESTSAPLSQNEVTCESGEYHHPSAPFLAIFDLARSEPFVPPPPSASLAPPPGKCPIRVHTADTDRPDRP
jgi:hypothetical protein